MGPVHTRYGATTKNKTLPLDSEDGSNSQHSPNSTTTALTICAVLAPPKHSEKRRENWRVAIQRRRVAEADAFQEMRLALPVAAQDLNPLGRLGILRVALCYVRLRSVMERMQASLYTTARCPESLPSFLESLGVTTEALLPPDAFLIIMSTTGDIIYVSDHVSKSLRAEKNSILGSNLYDYVHKSDHVELDRLLSLHSTPQIVPDGNGNFKTPRASITVVLQAGCRAKISGKVFLGPENFFIGLVEPLTRLPNPFDYEFPFPQFQILSVFDWAFTADMRTMIYVHPENFLGYTIDDFPVDSEGRIVDQFASIHAHDMLTVQEDFGKLISHGEHQMRPYRALAKGGGWAWFITQASKVVTKTRAPACDSRDGSLQVQEVWYWVGRDFMISDVMEPDQILGEIQLGGMGSRFKQQQHLQEVDPGSRAQSFSRFSYSFEDDPDFDELMQLVGEMDDYEMESSLDALCASFGAPPAWEHAQWPTTPVSSLGGWRGKEPAQEFHDFNQLLAQIN